MENSPIKILAIDDIHDNLITLKALIKEIFPDAKVFLASSGNQGIQIAADVDPNVILLDIVMPEMDGFEVCKKLKADPILSDIPVVFLTALKGDKDNRIIALESGGEAFLAKPIDQSELTAQIRAMVKLKSAKLDRRNEKERLEKLVEERTRDLKLSNLAKGNLLYNLRKEYDLKKINDQKLKESEEHYRNLVQHSPNIIYKFSNQRGVLFWSERVEDILGFTPKDLYQNPFLWNQSIHPDDKIAVQNIIKEAESSRSNTNFTIEYRVKNKNGKWIWLQDKFMHKTIINDEIIIESIATDITERKRSEETLYQSFLRYQMFFEHSGSSNSIFDINCCLLLQNKESISKFGFPEDESIGKSVYELFGDEAEDVYHRMRRVIETKKTEIFDIKFNLLTGTKWFRSSYLALIDESNTVKGVQVVSYDITDKKQIEIFQSLSSEIINILNSTNPIHDNLKKILQLIKNETSISALGIRLKQGEDFPFIDSLGYSDEFIKQENSILLKDKKQNICRFKDGKPMLECTCGYVISNANNSCIEPLTKTGSFWTNNTYPLLQLTTDKDPRLHARNTCIHSGYGSLAIIPIHSNEEIIGTLQLNDININAFTNEMIHSFEGICLHIGSTIMRKQAEEALLKSEAQLKEAMKIAKIANWEFDVKTNTFIFNDQYYNLLKTNREREGGYSLKSTLYSKKFIHPDYKEIVNKEISKAILSSDKNYCSKFDCCYIDTEEQNVFMIIEIRVLKNLDGKTIKLFGICQDITDKKLKDIIVEESRDKLQKVFDNSQVIISIIDLYTSSYIEVNDFAIRISEYSRDEIIGTKTSDLNWLSIDDRNLLLDILVQEGKIENIELSFKTKSGKIIYGVLNGQKIILNGKECLLTTTTDITERKLADIAILESEYKYRSLVETAQELVWKSDRNGCYTYLNPAWEKSYGYKIEEMLGKCFGEFQSPEVFERDKDIFFKHINEGRIKEYETTYIAKDGHELTLLINAMPVLNLNGNTVGMQGTAIDITEWKNAQKLLIKSEEKFSIAFKASPASVSINIINDGTYVEVNEVFLKQYGFTREEVIGSSSNDLNLWVDDKSRQMYVNELLKTGSLRNFEMKLRTRNGEIRDFLISSEIIDLEGKKCSLNFNIDITARKQLEENIKTEHANLLAIVENSKNGIWSVDRETNLVQTNAVFKAFIKNNLDIDIVEGINMVQILPLDQKAEFDQLYDLALLGESSTIIKNITTDKQTTYQEYNFNPIFVDNNIIGVSCRLVDITQRILDEQIILQRTQELRLLIDSTQDFIFSIDSVYRLITFNKSFRGAINSIIGRPPMLGESLLFDEFPKDEKIRWQEVIDNVLDGEFQSFESESTWFKNRLIILSSELSPIYDIQGNIIGVVGIIRDVTESKNLERKILNATIEAEENERNHFARELHEGLGPILSAIKLYSQWLQKPNLNTPKEELFLKIDAIIHEAIATTKEISFKLSPHILTNFGLESAVTAFIEKVQMSSNITFTFNNTLENRFEKELEICFYRVITECINNTIKYANAQNITIEMSVVNNRLNVKFWDDGIGFEYDEIMKKGNSGLGLLNMNQRIKVLGGVFNVTTAKGKGVKIEFEVPIKVIKS